MTAIAPICRLCGHGHFKTEPCPTGDVVDARARFTIARAAAIAKREGHAGTHCVMSAAYAQEELQAAMMGDTAMMAQDIFNGHDDDGRLVES